MAKSFKVRLAQAARDGKVETIKKVKSQLPQLSAAICGGDGALLVSPKGRTWRAY